MKKLYILSLLVVLGITSNAQIGRVKTLTLDTLTAAANDTSTVATVTGGYDAITFQTLSTQLGGTSDGKLVIQGSVDGTSYKTITEKAGAAVGWPVADSGIVTNGAIWQVTLYANPFKYYRVIGTGTASDTTLVTVNYLLR